MLLISLSIPFTLGAVSQQTNSFSNASSAAQIENLSVERVETDTVVVQFTTTEPVVAYLEYKPVNGETTPVLPVGSRNPTINHYFRVESIKGEEGDIFIIINGNKYTLNGKPIQISE
jgi:hypothetical protein